MSRYFVSRLSYRAHAKARKSTSHKFGWFAAVVFFASAFAFYSVLFPDNAGLWGKDCAQMLGKLMGVGRFLFPVFTGYASLLFLIHREPKGFALKMIMAATAFFAFLVFCSLLGEAVWKENIGGLAGLGGKIFFVRLFGWVGAWIVSMGLFSAVVLLMSGHTPGHLVQTVWRIVQSDWQEWKKVKTGVPPVKEKVRKPPVVAPASALSAGVKPSSPPKIMGFPPETPPKSESAASMKEGSLEKTARSNGAAEAVKTPPIQRSSVAEPPAVQPTRPKAAEPVKAAVSTIPYKSPSLDIFESAQKSKPVAKEELTARAKLLEQTLANFSIAASVVEIHPGPVITRYDLEPAPGVKVSSISSRADDLALAMRSIGIRVLAPIPGKGAVGVEIPNSQPENVSLKELLARPEFFNHESPLAFVLGKTVSGEPCIVDLASMPHLLVAGATGSGKSVAVHALICSILYRMPPDMVKFVMIDPKRLELPGYSGIPHLYDPRTGPLEASVITNSKQASKALARMVKVMEYRYDLFAKANVRNIDSYNKKMKAAGKPPEYYLVVIIDELADLMITSPKEVEDSIQRLAQMARAVGIHLVLATQRPSVDVITGVIKANLPARIALRVASSIDSRVIVDTVGADCLLGKGDMLYLPPASPEPMRVQGAYVSEKEVENLVQHVKQFGLPQYDDLFSSGSVLEFAVEDKKEMKDLIEALKLILERRRVSQDLLKAHLGSSARATNILSLLEVKQFIQKPEGSNRWEINFDMIEDFLAKANNIPEGELMQ